MVTSSQDRRPVVDGALCLRDTHGFLIAVMGESVGLRTSAPPCSRLPVHKMVGQASPVKMTQNHSLLSTHDLPEDGTHRQPSSSICASDRHFS